MVVTATLRPVRQRRVLCQVSENCCSAPSRRSLAPAPRRGRQIMAAASRPTYYLGLDFGTSGARATVVDDSKRIVTEAKRPYSQSGDADLAAVWQRVLFELVGSVPQDVRQHVAAVAIDGTSATTMLVDRNTGASLAPPKLYSEAQGADVVRQAAAMAPPAHTATSSTAALPKVLTWTAQRTWQALQASGASPCVLHQADWLASLLHGRRDTSDWNNALKMGYDPAAQAYPDWLARQDFFHLLPQVVVAPGAPVAPLTAEAAGATGLPRGCVVCGGTTDSIAAFVAADVSAAGQAVTSLGSTLAIKMLSTTRVDDAKYGVYSHRLGDSWLVGGASNTGGAVLRQHFTDEQLRQLSERIDASRPTGLSYYPLPSTGERFPVNDPQMPPLLAPRPPDDVLFLQGIFEGIARIEAQAYQRLHELGASRVTQVYTAGGGAVNAKWTAIRARELGVPVRASANGDASYGAALLAMRGAASTTK